jgi:hypothetical protein
MFLNIVVYYYNAIKVRIKMESLNGLRPELVQEFFENCKSVKVNRLFL